MALNLRMKGYDDEMVKEEDVVYYQTQNRKDWLGLVKVCAVKGNSLWVIVQVDARKIFRCNVMLYRKKDNENNEKEVSKDDER